MPASLTALLEAASTASPPAVRTFLEALFHSEVYVPLSRHSDGKPTLITKGGADSPNFLFVPSDDRKILPIFTEEAFLVSWAGEGVNFERKLFRTVLQLIDSSTWIHVNPNQAVGKELSSWELDLLRKGEESIPEIVSELCEDVASDIEIQMLGDEYAELKRLLVIVLEAYRDIREAFLVLIRKGNEPAFSPALGLLIDRPSDVARREIIKQEIEDIVESQLPTTQDFYFLDDLGNESSQNWTLFRQVNPFYLRHEELEQGKSWYQRLLGKFFSRNS